MSHPRLVAILSGIVASLVAFFVLTRWRLAGTLAGAAIIPLVHTFVSHWSNQGIDRSIALVRRRATQSPAQAESNTDSTGGPAAPLTAPRYSRSLPWFLVGLTCLAVGFGVYALVFKPPADRVIVHERVIERQVSAPAQSTAVPASNDTALVAAKTTTSTTNPSAGGDGTDAGNSPEAPTAPVEETPTTVAGNQDAPPAEPAPADAEPPADPGTTDVSAEPSGDTAP